ncbi:MAG: hypothetical protein Sup05_1304 [uncultured Candidatus Thioglobus sp.]|nr:MAG: hypothetical protein Sup05_1304 [uncultured Candidatus Thioglobus sp.]
MNPVFLSFDSLTSRTIKPLSSISLMAPVASTISYFLNLSAMTLPISNAIKTTNVPVVSICSLASKNSIISMVFRFIFGVKNCPTFHDLVPSRWTLGGTAHLQWQILYV